MARQNWWTNSDGLEVGFGTHSVDGNAASAVSTLGEVREVRVHIKGADLTDSALSGDAKANSVRIPANSYIVSASLQVYTAFAGASAVLDIGTYGTDDWAAIDDDGIDAAIAMATLVDNYYVGACDGAQIGTAVAEEFVISATYDTAAFTAGDAILTVKYIPAAR